MSVVLIRRLVGLVVLAVGIVLLVFAWNAYHSFASDVSQTFTGNATDHAMWLLVWGIVCAIVGIVVTLSPLERIGKRRA
jgi:uncharacterized membrane protein YidH (DUF202 family)